MRLQMTLPRWLGHLYLFALGLTILGCGGEPGRIHAKKEEVLGTYEAEFQKGNEKLELKADSTYQQSFAADGKMEHRSGTWKMEDHFLNGTDVILLAAVVSEDDPAGAGERIGDRRLNVHRRSGNIALAINEVADWYFVRVK